MSELFLGIDTSNYKTSIALINENAEVLFSRSELLKVKDGSRGLRQAEAFFQHSNTLPYFTEELFSQYKATDIRSIGVSNRPRNIEGSYMPCFYAGLNMARELSSALRLPHYCFSHQEGHAAAILENGEISYTGKPCLFYHLSGGTCEFLKCEFNEHGYDMKIVGGTKDISFGQLLDRFGVANGFAFPSGKYIDSFAMDSVSFKKRIPDIRIDDGFFNISGIETFLLRENFHNDTLQLKEISAEIMHLISSVILKASIQLSKKYNLYDIYLAGGVASALSIRNNLSVLQKNDREALDIKFNFGSPELSGDNAVGIALLTRRMYLNQ